MERFWRVNSSWSHVGASVNPRPPHLPDRPKVRVRALGRADGSPSFIVNGQPVAAGAVVDVDADDAPTLVFAGKAEYVA